MKSKKLFRKSGQWNFERPCVIQICFPLWIWAVPMVGMSCPPVADIIAHCPMWWCVSPPRSHQVATQAQSYTKCQTRDPKTRIIFSVYICMIINLSMSYNCSQIFIGPTSVSNTKFVISSALLQAFHHRHDDCFYRILYPSVTVFYLSAMSVFLLPPRLTSKTWRSVFVQLMTVFTRREHNSSERREWMRMLCDGKETESRKQCTIYETQPYAGLGLIYHKTLSLSNKIGCGNHGSSHGQLGDKTGENQNSFQSCGQNFCFQEKANSCSIK